mmetsp:Transcript_5410/g.8860  ORF Transcript_5410/g.8860 Transcript_5410/m.8860 type:complete len:91 (+) Transcript_5410:79-351(+)
MYLLTTPYGFETEHTPRRLQIHNASQLLDAIQKKIALLNHISVLGILEIRSVGFNNASIFVNLGRQSSRSDKATQLKVKILCCDTKRHCH